MIERRRYIEPPSAPPPRSKRKAQRIPFTEAKVRSLPVKPYQHFVWDAGRHSVRGLCVLVNPTGTKTYFVNYRFPGSKRLHYLKLGRVGELAIAEVRAKAEAARRSAFENKDPKANDPNKSDAFEVVFERYIAEEQIGRNKNASAMGTRGVVLHNCGEWQHRAVATISYREISSLLANIRDGKNGKARPATAVRLFAHLRDFFKWCVREQIITANPIANMLKPATIATRNRHYSDEELKAIWRAADQLAPAEGSYIKLMMLLALRRDELAQARWTEFDNAEAPNVFTVPTERVKLKATAKALKKPTYIVPLPPLAQRLLKGARRDGELLFPRLDMRSLKVKLVKAGAPQDFMVHAFRHTIATWLENKGRSEWERGLVLNHSGGGSVTGGYSHGYPVELKKTMLVEWAEHVERLVSPGEGVARLR